MNSKEKSNVALARAIVHFTEEGYHIFLPLGDQGGPVDLVVSVDGVHLRRVQCKFTAAKHHASYHRRGVIVWKATCSLYSGRTSNVRKRYEIHDFDLLFVATPDGNYLIDWVEYVATVSPIPYDIILGSSLDRYKLAS